MREKEIQNSIVEYLELIGAYTKPINSGQIMAMYGQKTLMVKLADKGTPDILLCYKGDFIGIEVKKTEKIREHWLNTVERYKQTGAMAKSNHRIFAQNVHKEMIEKAGGIWYIVASLSEVVEIFEEHHGAPVT